MRLFSLVLVNLKRNTIRTVLTFLSVVVALFLFCALYGVLDTLDSAVKVGSEQRLVTRNKISLVFPIPLAYRERIASVDGVRSVTVQNWFGGRDPKDPRNWYAQFAVDAATFFPMYTNDMEIVAASVPPDMARVQEGETPRAQVPPGVDPKLAAFMNEQTACVVGEKLFQKQGWKLGQTVMLAGTIYPGEWPYTIRAVYRAKQKAFGEETMFFHWKYLYEKSNRQAAAGIFVLQLDDPERAGAIAKQVDGLFENSSYATRTETERAFQAGFISMYGNLPFLIRFIGFAVVFAILLVAANTMMMAVRERTNEYGVLKTLGFDDGTVFRVVLLEGALLTLVGGVVGAVGAKAAIEGSNFNMGGFLPPMTVSWATVATGIAIAVAIGAASGLLPAWQASRLHIVDALRRVE